MMGIPQRGKNLNAVGTMQKLIWLKSLIQIVIGLKRENEQKQKENIPSTGKNTKIIFI